MTIDNKQYLAPPVNTLKRSIVELRAWAAYSHWKNRLAKLINNDSKILECGCGPGFLSKLIKKWFPTVDLYSCDYEYDLIYSVKKELGYTNVFQANAQEIPVRSNTIDVVISFHMVEHLEKPSLFFDNVNRVLKPGGYLIYATPNPIGIPAKIMKDKWCGIRADHISLLSPLEWKAATEHSGFRIIQEGTTGLSGIPVFQKFPIGIINFGSLFLFGFFPWDKGEAYIGIYQKSSEEKLVEKQSTLLDKELSTLICCPVTNQELVKVSSGLVSHLNQLIEENKIFNLAGKKVLSKIDAAWMRVDKALLYPSIEGIPVLLAEEAIIIDSFMEQYLPQMELNKTIE
jgi:SAM-dependent methyltransferase/uncharacterized protein YbaR (Trm112 family)